MRELTTEEKMREKTFPLVELFGEPIHCYSREQAIDDGVLVDVTDTLKTRGYSQAQICLTIALWEAIQVPEDSTDDLMGRIHDVLQLGQWAIMGKRKAAEGLDQIQTTYKVKVGPRLLDLWLVWNATEGVTIGFPDDF